MNRPIPPNWTTDCSKCQWFLAVYGRDNCYLFDGLWFEEGDHVLNNYGAKEIPGANEAYWKEVNR